MDQKYTTSTTDNYTFQVGDKRLIEIWEDS